MSLELPATLGPYELSALLGAGGMGEVYRGKDTRLGRLVAVKVLPRSLALDPERLRRFEQEARVIASLNHPNLLQVYDTGVVGESPYLVMELLEGETLRHRMRGHPLPFRPVMEIALQMARGLSAAHEKGITHRDLKPENTFITRDEHVKLLDFGLAKLKQSHPLSSGDQTIGSTEPHQATRFGAVLGTAAYMSPEQIQGGLVDPRSDIFSFGILLWEMLVGTRPFQGESTVDLLHAILRDEPMAWPSQLPIPPSLERILLRCLRKDPLARFQNASDLAFALEGVDFNSTHRWPSLRLPRRVPRTILVAVGASLLGILGLWTGRSMGKGVTPSLQRLTYHHGTITQARFTPDGENILFSMDLPGRASEVWLGRVDGVGAKPLGLPPGTRLMAVSPKGELALLHPDPGSETGLLSRVPLTGGEPREVLDRVLRADWLPDGTSLAVLRQSVDGRVSLEFPIGNRVFEASSTETLSDIRVSPDGRWAAFTSHQGIGQGAICTVDRKGNLRRLATAKAESLVWSANSREVVFVAQLAGDQKEIQATDLRGHQRRIMAIPNRANLHDRARSGSLLLRHCYDRSEMAGTLSGIVQNGDLSWLQSTTAADISHDGRIILFAELQEGAQESGVYIRRAGLAGPIRIGEGDPLVLSPDGAWAAVRPLRGRPEIHLLPTGQGQPRHVSLQGLLPDWVAFRGGGDRLLLGGARPGERGFHVYEVDCTTQRLELRIPDVSRSAYPVLSPDGRLLALGPVNGRLQIRDLEKGSTRLIGHLSDQEWPIQWCKDGKGLLVADLSALPAKVLRMDLVQGQKTLVREIAPSSRDGVSRIRYLAITPDGKEWVYSFERSLASDLYLLDHWQ